jgi:hypothetical protein
VKSAARAAPTFSHREKVAAKQPDEGMRRSQQSLSPCNPSPVAFGDTLSLWERVDLHRREIFS